MVIEMSESTQRLSVDHVFVFIVITELTMHSSRISKIDKLGLLLSQLFRNSYGTTSSSANSVRRRSPFALVRTWIRIIPLAPQRISQLSSDLSALMTKVATRIPTGPPFAKISRERRSLRMESSHVKSIARRSLAVAKLRDVVSIAVWGLKSLKSQAPPRYMQHCKISECGLIYESTARHLCQAVHGRRNKRNHTLNMLLTPMKSKLIDYLII